MLTKRARGLTADAKQKVSLGRGLVRPDVTAILFDEPLTVIDPHLKWQLRSQAEGAAPRVRPDHGLRHARPDRGAHLRREGGGDVRGRGRADRHAGGSVRAAGAHLRRLFHRLARHERRAGRRSRGTAHGSATQDVPLARAYRRPAGRREDWSSASGRNSSALSGNGARHAGPRRPRSTTSAATASSSSTSTATSSTRSPTRTPRSRRRSRQRRASIPANVHIYADGRLVEGKPFGGSGMMDKTWNNRAWFMVLPVLILVAFNAIIPLMTVVNYSVQETFGDNVFFFHGVELVRGRAAFRALPRRAAAASSTFTFTILVDRDPARRGDRADDAAEGRLGLRLPRADGAAAAHSVERRRRHLEHLCAAGHRPARPRAERPRLRLQLHAPAGRRLVHADPDGRLALDVAGRAPRLCRAELDPRRLSTRRPRSTAPRAGRCSATSSCRR